MEKGSIPPLWDGKSAERIVQHFKIIKRNFNKIEKNTLLEKE